MPNLDILWTENNVVFLEEINLNQWTCHTRGVSSSSVLLEPRISIARTINQAIKSVYCVDLNGVHKKI